MNADLSKAERGGSPSCLHWVQLEFRIRGTADPRETRPLFVVFATSPWIHCRAHTLITTLRHGETTVCSSKSAMSASFVSCPY